MQVAAPGKMHQHCAHLSWPWDPCVPQCSLPPFQHCPYTMDTHEGQVSGGTVAQPGYQPITVGAQLRVGLCGSPPMQMAWPSGQALIEGPGAWVQCFCTA